MIIKKKRNYFRACKLKQKDNKRKKEHYLTTKSKRNVQQQKKAVCRSDNENFWIFDICVEILIEIFGCNKQQGIIILAVLKMKK